MSLAGCFTAMTAKFAPPTLPTKNVDGAERPPLAGGLETVTLATPILAMSVESTAACSVVLETNVVVKPVPFHCTTEDGMKFLPVTVITKLAPPATAELGLSRAIFGGGTLTGKSNA